MTRTYVVNTFEGRYHGVHVAGALHAAVDTTIGQLNQYLLHWLVVVLRVNEISAAKFLS